MSETSRAAANSCCRVPERGLAHRGPQLRVVEQASRGRCERGGIAVGDETGDAVEHDFRRTPDRVVTAGSPSDAASMSETGIPSLSDVSSTMSHAE